MIEKMTLEQFEQIKNQLSNLAKGYETSFDEHKNDVNYDSAAEEQRVAGEYLRLQDQLLSYDLSNIPFEAWEGFTVVSDAEHKADFSKTKANIDFKLIEYYGNGNFKGCNIRNLDNIQTHINSNDFDEKTIQMNPSLFLTDIFSTEFKNKYYNCSLTIDDLSNLSSLQLEEIKQKNLKSHVVTTNNFQLMLDLLGLEKNIDFYKFSKEDFYIFSKMMPMSMSEFYNDKQGISTVTEFEQELKNMDVSEFKNACFKRIRQQITNTNMLFLTKKYPKEFINENPDLFLVNVNIPEEVKKRFFDRKLKIQDLLEYKDIFKNIPVDYFMDPAIYIDLFIRNNFGLGKLQELVFTYPDVFGHITQANKLYSLSNLFVPGKDLDTVFKNAIKEYILEYESPVVIINNNSIRNTYSVPEWASSLNLKIIDKLSSTDELLSYDDSVCVLDKEQRIILSGFGIDNIKKFDQETGFFSHKAYDWSPDLEMLKVLGSYYKYRYRLLSNEGIDFKNGNLTYEEFKEQFAKFLNSARIFNTFKNSPNYDWVTGEFRDNHPELFVDMDAPKELKDAFYKNLLNPDFLCQHKDCVKYLVDKDLQSIIKASITLNLPGLDDGHGMMLPNSVNFMDEYISRYGNEKFLELCSKYGAALSKITIQSLNGEINDEKAIEKSLRESIYNSIVSGNSKLDYSYLANVPEMIEEYPNIFINLDNFNTITAKEKQSLTNRFYTGQLDFDDIKKHPELIEALKDKNLFIAFGDKNGINFNNRILLDTGRNRISNKRYSDLELLKVYGNEKFLELCAKYGRYMDGIGQYISKDITIRNGKYINFAQDDIDFKNGISVDEISKMIENMITKESKLGNIAYYPEDAPDFLKKNNPELFLDDDAPKELKNAFYNYNYVYTNHMSFRTLKEHKEWLPYLKGKSIATSLLRCSYQKEDLIKYLDVFGEEKGIKLGINRAETVDEMIKSHQIELMKDWYDKTGGKFLPDFVVMQNFDINEADKFLTSGQNWSNLMRIKNFADNAEARDAMLKLAYSFGAFDQDQRGFKKLQDLLTDLPKKIDAEQGYIFKQLDNQISKYSQKEVYYGVKSISYIGEDGKIHTTIESSPTINAEEAYQQMINHVRNANFVDLLDNKTLLNLLESLKKENVNIDFSKDIFSQLYRKDDDGSYTLTINTQSYPKSTQAIRDILEKFRDLPMLTPDRAHQLFGGFELKYDPDFREFLLSNMDKIMNNPEYGSMVANIQKQFSNIKAANSNRTLTWELAVSYVQENKFTSVNVGNERAAEISAIAGYSQEDFNKLQQIYNYGKQRTFSSIPRIEQNVKKVSGNYTYETLRLDDPLAMAIGTLTDCCQELNDCAEVCMEHSMVDKNGRVFVIRDDKGNIVAQSWVWRNKDVLCFDNIEIPNKTFTRISKEHPELGRTGFTSEIFDIYKQAAHDLIEEDEKVYRKMLESGKISQEQYDGLRLGKITVGLGYNDIAESLKQKSIVDKGYISRPLLFTEPIKLKRGLYTADSTTQYILEERDDRKTFDGETITPHNDTYIEYDDHNFTDKSLMALERLELTTKEEPRKLSTAIGDYADSEHLVTELASNYGLNPKTTRIIMHPNFAIIYDKNNDRIKIADLLFNTKVDNEDQQMDIENKVVMQIRLALDQLSYGEYIDISNLNEKQKEMYAKAMELTDELDIERGVSHAR